ncbi:uncharacterized protein LOC110905209 [Helianthus annuus]|uniref:uncharacterized protein LOC110905209 n=1 Tax=Helianthus annuus TaxID=4232 RepID=UPI000B8F2B38|nr:uncharacterized protein LOC110905209 [Helianthus annuus]
MNFGTINIKGAGGVGKAKVVRGLLSKYGLNFIAIQETQFRDLPDRVIKRFWDNTAFDYIKVDADGRSGGLLSIWSPGVFKKNLDVKTQNFILVKGQVTGEQEEIIVVNVYASTVPSNRRQLWNELLSLKQSVHEYNMGGRRYTFMSGDGRNLSKIDRVLVCGEFIMRWPDATLLALNRDVSDHCPLILTTVNNFGPTPFRVFHCWMDATGFDEAVRKGLGKGCDSSFKDECVAIKFKARRDELKTWRSSEKAKEEELLATTNENLQKLETEAERRSLTAQEIETWQGYKRTIKEWHKAKAKDLIQKSRIKWIALGDENNVLSHGSK